MAKLAFPMEQHRDEDPVLLLEGRVPVDIDHVYRRTELIEQRLQRSGHIVAKVTIRPNEQREGRHPR
jgi:hypothetical protein